MSKLSMTIELS